MQGQVSARTKNQALSALLFLYRVVLGIDLLWMENDACAVSASEVHYDIWTNQLSCVAPARP